MPVAAMGGLDEAQQVLDFWFGVPPGASRREWFRKDAAFDAAIRERFGTLHAACARREREAWRASAETLLALVLVLDQFSRNLYRDDARAFAQDRHARECARQAVERGDDLALLPVQRQFLYLPFEHSEALRDQELALERFEALERFPGMEGLAEWARRHREIIARFGRFPHRNAALGRPSTPEETAFLAQPGSGF